MRMAIAHAGNCCRRSADGAAQRQMAGRWGEDRVATGGGTKSLRSKPGTVPPITLSNLYRFGVRGRKARTRKGVGRGMTKRIFARRVRQGSASPTNTSEPDLIAF